MDAILTVAQPDTASPLGRRVRPGWWGSPPCEGGASSSSDGVYATRRRCGSPPCGQCAPTSRSSRPPRCNDVHAPPARGRGSCSVPWPSRRSASCSPRCSRASTGWPPHRSRPRQRPAVAHPAPRVVAARRTCHSPHPDRPSDRGHRARRGRGAWLGRFTSLDLDPGRRPITSGTLLSRRLVTGERPDGLDLGRAATRPGIAMDSRPLPRTPNDGRPTDERPARRPASSTRDM